MYGREVDGATLTFGVSGKLILNNLVMFDDETGSLWSQAYGTAIEGPLAGSGLELIASRLMTWAAWRELYPATRVLDKNGGYAVDGYRGYYKDDRAGIMGRRVNDTRREIKELVLGVEIGSVKRAYPYAELSASPVVNDRLGETAILVTFDEAARSATAWNRVVDGLALTFETADPPADDGTRAWMRDEQTGTLWNAATGATENGPLSGARLEQIPATPSFWFAWADLFPDTTVYEVGPTQ